MRTSGGSHYPPPGSGGDDGSMPSSLRGSLKGSQSAKSDGQYLHVCVAVSAFTGQAGVAAYGVACLPGPQASWVGFPWAGSIPRALLSYFLPEFCTWLEGPRPCMRPCTSEPASAPLFPPPMTPMSSTPVCSCREEEEGRRLRGDRGKLRHHSARDPTYAHCPGMRTL